MKGDKTIQFQWRIFPPWPRRGRRTAPGWFETVIYRLAGDLSKAKQTPLSSDQFSKSPGLLFNKVVFKGFICFAGNRLKRFEAMGWDQLMSTEVIPEMRLIRRIDPIHYPV